MKKAQLLTWAFLSAYTCFVVSSFIMGFEPGERTAKSLLLFLREMLIILPPAFILIGLFEVWVPKTLIERHLGQGSGLAVYLWAFLLAGTTVGGLYVSFPVASALQSKGARLGFIFAYVGFSGFCRIPMTLFEISFLGAEFTLVRYLVGVPLTLFVSDRLGWFLESRGYQLRHPEHD